MTKFVISLFVTLILVGLPRSAAAALNVTFVNGVLTIQGGEDADVIFVSLWNEDMSRDCQVTLETGTNQTFDDVVELNILCGGGKDYVRLKFIQHLYNFPDIFIDGGDDHDIIIATRHCEEDDQNGAVAISGGNGNDYIQTDVSAVVGDDPGDDTYNLEYGSGAPLGSRGFTVEDLSGNNTFEWNGVENTEVTENWIVGFGGCFGGVGYGSDGIQTGWWFSGPGFQLVYLGQ